jgi:hypothetical protein
MRPTPALVLLLALLACGDENRTPVTETPASDRTSVSGNDTTHAPAQVIPGVSDTTPRPLPPPRTATAALAPLGESSLRGEVRLRTVAARTAVDARLAGGHGSMTYAGAVRAGSCGAMGPTVAALVPATADSLGGGRSASDLGFSLDSLLRHPHVVAFGPGGRPEVCGEIHE